jgi:hypothetical protein
MAFPRFTAVAFLIFLIGSLSLLCIGVLALRQPAISISSEQYNLESVQGKIVSLGPDMDFILETATGQYLHFRCASSCHTSLAHLQRHLYEQATTVVYYVEGPGNHLLALNVD